MINRVSWGKELESLWPAVSDPFSTHQWHKTWWQTLGQDWEPYFLQSDNILAPLIRQGSTVKFSGDIRVTDYHDLIGDEAVKEKSWKEIMAYFRHDGVTKVVIENLRADSPSLSFFRNHSGFQISSENTTPILHLPENWEKYLGSLKNHDRHELRRKMRRFEETYPQIQIEQSKEISHLLTLMRKNAAKEEFLTAEIETFFRQIARAIANHVLITNLLVNDTVAASSLSFVFGKTIYLYNAGFDSLNFPGSGHYLNVKLIQRAIQSEIIEYNFLRGNEHYKYQLGAVDLPIYTVTWYNK